MPYIPTQYILKIVCIFMQSVVCHSQEDDGMCVTMYSVREFLTPLNLHLVPSTHSQQVSRLMGRDGVDEEQALKRIQAQIPLSSKCGWADVVIDNSHDRHSTRQQVEKLVESMNRLSSCRRFLYVAVLSTLVVLFTAIAICLCMNFKAMSTLF